MFYGYDPSPPKPKVKGKGQGKAKAKLKLKEGDSNPTVGEEPDAAFLDDVRNELAKAVITDEPAMSTELPLVTISPPSGDSPEMSGTTTSEYFIRATQGHSLKLESTAHLTSVMDDEDGRERVGLMVHGTRWELWETLSMSEFRSVILQTDATVEETGLSRMVRQHIHLAPALSDHRITPRSSSTLYIYLDLGKLQQAGIPVYTSTNGVVLTPGDEHGIVLKSFWKRAERVDKGERIVVWEDGKEVDPDNQQCT